MTRVFASVHDTLAVYTWQWHYAHILCVKVFIIETVINWVGLIMIIHSKEGESPIYVCTFIRLSTCMC